MKLERERDREGNNLPPNDKFGNDGLATRSKYRAWNGTRGYTQVKLLLIVFFFNNT